jgi:hypothetical protein
MNTQIKKVLIRKIRCWEKNPRAIQKKDYARLKKHIQKYGQYKPLIVFRKKDYYVTLGGNMRLRALRDLKFKEVFILEVFPKNEQEKIELSLIDNDRGGYYDEQQLAELIYPYKDIIKLTDFKVDIDIPVLDLDKLVNRVASSAVDKKLESGYEVIIECESEEEQQQLFERFQKEGLRCRVLIY